MKLTHILVAATLSVAAMKTAMGSPQTITWSAQNAGAALGSSGGNDLAPGALVRLGYFTVSPEEIAAAFNDVEVLDSQFIEVSREEVGNFGGVVYGQQVETTGSEFGVAGAFAQTITLDSDDVPAGARFYIWVSNEAEAETATAQAIFSSASWQLQNAQVAALQWGIENVDPSDGADVYLAEQGPQISKTVGGKLNKLRQIDTTPVGPGDLEDPDGNGIVVLLEEAFLFDAARPADAQMPYMAAADVLVYNRKSGGEATGWDLYRSDDLEYRVEVTSDFRTWKLASEVLGQAATVTAEDRQAGGERVALKLPVKSGRTTGTYFRVQVRRLVEGETAQL
ncbi:MAG: hypothetical protein R3F19_22470 [Verrucomicrobiales bacterium]